MVRVEEDSLDLQDLLGFRDPLVRLVVKVFQGL